MYSKSLLRIIEVKKKTKKTLVFKLTLATCWTSTWLHDIAALTCHVDATGRFFHFYSNSLYVTCKVRENGDSTRVSEWTVRSKWHDSLGRHEVCLSAASWGVRALTEHLYGPVLHVLLPGDEGQRVRRTCKHLSGPTTLLPALLLNLSVLDCELQARELGHERLVTHMERVRDRELDRETEKETKGERARDRQSGFIERGRKWERKWESWRNYGFIWIFCPECGLLITIKWKTNKHLPIIELAFS